MTRTIPFLDPLYGEMRFDEPIDLLIKTPVVQRLRHVRLSNIDSMDIPSISNLSRFEHVLGTAYLAKAVGFRNSLTKLENLALQGGALLHDWAITAYGHLVEEALQYVGTKFNHERRVEEIFLGKSNLEIGGVDLQILSGRESGVSSWAESVIGGQLAGQLLNEIVIQINGKGKLGKLISGDIDLDNMDNVYRMAFHMGLPVDPQTPMRLAHSIVGVDLKTRNPIFKTTAESEIENWREVRHAVYQRLMLSERDFAGKVMMLFATVKAYQAGQLAEDEWNLTDTDFIERLRKSSVDEVRDTAQRWFVGELWHCTDLIWVAGDRPRFAELLSFSNVLTEELKRICFAYGIKDKRNRKVSISYEDGSVRDYGRDSAKWLLGIGSPKRSTFSAREKKVIRDLILAKFGDDISLPNAGARLL